MGSVSSYHNCPNCKTKESLFVDFYYKSGEEYSSCSECGYHHSFRWKRDEDGKLKRKDESGDFSFSNLVSEEIHIEKPYGAYMVEIALGGASCGTLETNDDYQKFISEIASFINQEHDIKRVVVSRLIGDKIEKEVVFQNTL